MPSLQALLDSGVPLSQPRAPYGVPSLSAKTGYSHGQYIGLGHEAGESLHAVTYSFEVDEHVAEYINLHFDNFVERIFSSDRSARFVTRSEGASLNFFKNARGTIAASYFRPYPARKHLRSLDEDFLYKMFRHMKEVIPDAPDREDYTSWVTTVIPPLKINRDGFPDTPSDSYISGDLTIFDEEHCGRVDVLRHATLGRYIIVAESTRDFMERSKPYEYLWANPFRGSDIPTKIMLFKLPSFISRTDVVCSGKFVSVLNPESILMNPECREFAEVASRSQFRGFTHIRLLVNNSIDRELLPRRWQRVFSKWADVQSSGQTRNVGPAPLGPSTDDAALSFVGLRR